MANGNTLHIVNYFGEPIDAVITNNNWNCCDNPSQGQTIGLIQPDQQVELFFCRKDGHGCNGQQGVFQIGLNSNMLVNLNFDSGGNMGGISTSGGFGAYMAQDPDGTYSLIVGPQPVGTA